MHGSLLHMEGTELNLDAMIKIVNAYMEENGITHEKQFEIYYPRACIKLPLSNAVTPSRAESLVLNQKNITDRTQVPIYKNLLCYSYRNGDQSHEKTFTNETGLRKMLREILPKEPPRPHTIEDIILRLISIEQQLEKLNTSLNHTP